MNMRFDLKYLSGGDSVFGPDYGGASVFTNTRAGYSLQCPNIGRLLKNLHFTPRGESQLMASILDQHQSPEIAAAAWLKLNPSVVSAWLDGVYTFDGRAAIEALAGEHKAIGAWSFEHWVSAHKIPVGDTVAVIIDYVKAHGRVVFDGVSALIRGSVDGLTRLLLVIPAPLLVIAIAALSWVLRRSPPLETLSLVIVAALVSTAIGVPLGIAAAHRPGFYAALRPVLDLMQTLPTFVYLIPTLVLFGLGVVPGLISTVIFALPAPIRLTQLGISSVPESLLEAGQAF